MEWHEQQLGITLFEFVERIRWMMVSGIWVQAWTDTGHKRYDPRGVSNKQIEIAAGMVMQVGDGARPHFDTTTAFGIMSRFVMPT
jgi:hypothetical protein